MIDHLVSVEWIAAFLTGLAALVAAWRAGRMARGKKPAPPAAATPKPATSPEPLANMRLALAAERIAASVERIERHIDVGIQLIKRNGK
ncbi:MAG: hypothetical protein JJ926_03740 [Roseitalea sp.]|nr:hypothetical protein [Roseitalea sp.]MBO6950968.1 hypothetical protein [Rhizobiaceae bacterium]MBO6591045.1 hypothetical protein [Roseitalea sp.]MBO6599697.1 hypothetical protein [Roseitalea sp.]MBO6611453.1 hypothetical protein [Roseitalea sp.]